MSVGGERMNIIRNIFDYIFFKELIKSEFIVDKPKAEIVRLLVTVQKKCEKNRYSGNEAILGYYGCLFERFTFYFYKIDIFNLRDYRRPTLYSYHVSVSARSDKQSVVTFRFVFNRFLLLFSYLFLIIGSAALLKVSWQTFRYGVDISSIAYILLSAIVIVLYTMFILINDRKSQKTDGNKKLEAWINSLISMHLSGIFDKNIFIKSACNYCKGSLYYLML